MKDYKIDKSLGISVDFIEEKVSYKDVVLNLFYVVSGKLRGVINVT